MFKKLDFVSSGPSLMIDNQSKLQSNLGASLSIGIILGIILFTWFLGNSIVYKDKPQILIQNEVLEKAIPIEMNKVNSFFGFNIVRADGLIIPELQDSIEIDIYYWQSMVNDGSGPDDQYFLYNATKLEIVSCEGFKEEEEIPAETLKGQKCIKDLNMTLGGDYTEAKQDYLFVALKICTNRTDPFTGETKICPPIEKIKEAINAEHYLYFTIQDYTIDPKNFGSPLRTRYTPIYAKINFDLYKEIELFYQNIEVKTDIGLITEEIRSDNAYQIYNRLTDFSYRTDETIATIWIYVNKNITFYHRRYLKIQELGASLGGIFKFFQISSFIITYLFNMVDMKTHVMNNLYNFDSSLTSGLNEVYLQDFNIKKMSDLEGHNVFDPPAKLKIGDSNQMIKINTKKESKFDFSNKINSIENKMVDSYATLQNNQISFTKNYTSQEKENPLENITDKQSVMKDNFINKEKTIIDNRVEYIKRTINNQTVLNIGKDLGIITAELSFSKWETFKMYACCKLCKSKTLLNKAKIYDYLTEEALSYFNVSNIVDMKKHLQLLKYASLNEHQLISFDIVRKPYITNKKEINLNRFDELMLACRTTPFEEKIIISKDYFLKKSQKPEDIDDKDVKIFQSVVFGKC